MILESIISQTSRTSGCPKKIENLDLHRWFVFLDFRNKRMNLFKSRHLKKRMRVFGLLLAAIQNSKQKTWKFLDVQENPKQNMRSFFEKSIRQKTQCTPNMSKTSSGRRLVLESLDSFLEVL